ncbi:MAG: dihydropteroate synthase [Bryobacteraceae bacterium]|jgi:5-methyltetrahydrofolate--homocysteine methyltransferase
MILIGELINATRKKVRAAVETRDADYIRDLARRQAEAGAAILDVNGGVPEREAESLEWLVGLVQEVTDLPLAIDSSDPEVVRRAIPLCKSRPTINSITAEPARLDALLPVLKEFRPRVIALCMSPAGVPAGLEDRIETASRLVDRLIQDGAELDDIFVDPCVMPVSTGGDKSVAVLDAIGCIMQRFPGVHTSVGLSNVSFGVPTRKLMNQTFLMLLMARGLDAAILDPLDRQLIANITAAEALLGRDEYCQRYLRAYRAGKLEPLEQAPAISR